MSRPKGIYTSKYSQYSYGVGLSVKEFTTTNLTNLAEIDDKAFPADWVVRVQTLRANFRLIADTTLTADGITVVTAKSRTKQWVREAHIDFVWSKQTEWYIDPINGNDENVGNTTSAALKTLAEWYRRTGGVADGITMEVQILSTLPTTDPIPRRVGWTNAGKLRILGTRTAVATGMLTYYTAPNYAANTGAQITAAIDWAPHVGRSVYITECNAWVRIAKNLGGGVALVTQPANVTGDNTITFTTPYPIPAVGNTFTVYNVPTVYAYNGIGIISDNRSDATDNVVFRDLRFLEEAGGYKSIKGSVDGSVMAVFIRVEFGYWQPVGPYYFAMCFFGADSAKPWSWFFNSGSLVARCCLQRLGYAVFDGGGESTLWDYLVVGGYVSVNSRSKVINSMGAFDGSSPIRIRDGGRFAGDAPIFGSGNTGTCLTVGARAQFSCSNFAQITVDGTTQLSVGGYANLLPDLTASAGAVLPALAPCTTFAQIAAAPFNGKAFNHANGAYAGPAISS